MSIEDIGRSREQANPESETTTDSGDDDETPTDFPLDQYPTTAIGGTATKLRPCYHDLLDEYWAGLVLEDPFVYTEDAELKSTAIFSHTEENEFTVVNLGDDESVSLDGAVIRPDHTAFRANQVERFEDANGFNPSIDRVTVRLTGREGKYTLLCLDADGLQRTGVSRDSSGIPECTDDDNLFDGVPPGYCSDAIQLRPELEGEEVILMRQYADEVLNFPRGYSHWLTVLMRDSGTEKGLSVVDPNVEGSLGEGGAGRRIPNPEVSVEEEGAGRLPHLPCLDFRQ